MLVQEEKTQYMRLELYDIDFINVKVGAHPTFK